MGAKCQDASKEALTTIEDAVAPLFAQAKVVQVAAARVDCDPLAFWREAGEALAYPLRHPATASLILTASTPANIDMALRAATTTPDRAAFARA